AGYAKTNDKAKSKLLTDEIIDGNDKILDIGKLFEQIPEGRGLKINRGKIIGEGLPARPTVRLDKENFEKLRDLWNQMTKRYLLKFEKPDDNELDKILLNILSGDNIFIKPVVSIVETIVRKGENRVEVESGGFKSAESTLGVLRYGEFLKQLNKRTHLSINMLHKNIIAARKNKTTTPELFNVVTIENIIKNFEAKFTEVFAQKFSYHSLDYVARTKVVADNGEFVEELPQGEILKVNPPERIIVYGKLPRGSIKLPTYTGGMTSPDFVYAVKKKNSNDIELHLIVKTQSDNPRLSDEIAVNSQKKAFETIGKNISQNIKWRMETNVKNFEKELKKLTEN
ncbi:MAG: hypothetical protein LBK06_09030, partial [Planctomycetaceae bacterium]|nr:hypothetical protein [Planctomycetaceae bacterium]